MDPAVIEISTRCFLATRYKMLNVCLRASFCVYQAAFDDVADFKNMHVY